MTDKPRRPILHLKFPPAAPVVSAPVAAPPKASAWKCKPCGKTFQLLNELADADSVRCPACNARLGLAADFRAEPPNLDAVRARMVAEPSPRPAAPASSGSRRGR